VTRENRLPVARFRQAAQPKSSGGCATSKGQAKMKVEWNDVKKLTLWSYEDLIRKLQDVLAYGFVQEHYNHTMRQARSYAASIRRGYLQDRGEMTAYVDKLASYLRDLEARRIGTYMDLVRSVATRAQCEAFLQETDFAFGPLIEILNYLLRWVLPFKTPMRQFIDADKRADVELLGSLKKQGIKSNLDLLEVGRTEEGRAQLASTARIPAAELLILVHRVDISRLAYVRGKTVKHLCGGGYDRLEKIAEADAAEMEEKMGAYYRTLGKTAADFKAVIPLAWMIGGAKTIPRVVAV
jgi:Domain of unknown function (DUF4332)